MHGSTHQPLQDAIGSMMLAALAALQGDVGAIIFGAVAGAFWPAASLKTDSRLEALTLMFRLTLTALALASSAAYLLEVYPGVPASRTLMPLSFLIALMGNKWAGAQEHLAGGFRRLFQGLLKWALDRMSAQPGDGK